MKFTIESIMKQSTKFLRVYGFERPRHESVLIIKNNLKKSYEDIVTSKDVNEMLSIESINVELERDKFYPALDNLVENFTKKNRNLLLICNEEYTPWTMWCLAISDKNIFVVEESAGIANIELLNKMNLNEEDIINFALAMFVK